MKAKLTSNGNPEHTHVKVGDVELGGVTSATFEADGITRECTLTVNLLSAGIEAEGELYVLHEGVKCKVKHIELEDGRVIK